MAKARSSKQPKKPRKSSALVVRFDEQSKAFLAEAAGLRRISVSDYVRMVAVAQAQREVHAAQEQTLALTPEEQLAFWNALNAPVRLTDNQQKLGEMMRAKA